MGTTKRKSRKKTSSYSRPKRKSKVYIPASKAIALCLGVIAVCMVLLLINTLSKTSDKPKEKTGEPVSIVQRFEAQNEKAQESSRQPESKKEESPKKEAQKAPATQPVETKKPEKEIDQKPQETKPAKPKETDFGLEKAKNGAQLCFVFDDGGQNIEQLKEFLELPFPITVAVLPQLAHSVQAADLVRKSGNELILHQPMQSVNGSINPGPGAITPDMTEAQIISQLFVNMEQIGPIAGMNNHEGSGITADAEKMEIILTTASEYGIYFLDSRTNVETQVPYVARELGYSYYERNIFLDNEKTRKNALAELKKGLAIANKNGSVIMIGHIWSADFLPALLMELYPELKAKGYTFSLVSKSKALKN